MTDASLAVHYQATGADAPGPEVTLIADDPAAAARARRAIDAAGATSSRLRSIDEAIAAPPSAPMWIELDGIGSDPGPAAERLLAMLDRSSGERGLSAVVAAPRAMLDALAAQLSSPAIEILIAPSLPERAAAAAMLAAWAGRGDIAHDTARDADAGRLRQLSEEVARIAATLAQLSGDPLDPLLASGDPLPPAAAPATKEIPAIPIETVRATIRARRLRERYFKNELFADPAWDMLLDLLSAELSQHRVPVSSLCIAASVPPTTALRWIKSMTASGLLLRRSDPHDGRRVFVELAPAASEAIRRYFAEVGGGIAA